MDSVEAAAALMFPKLNGLTIDLESFLNVKTYTMELSIYLQVS